MSIPDSHTALFTRIPEGIEKVWTKTIRDCDSGLTVNASRSKHSDSLISCIKLSVQFDRDAMFEREELDEDDDISTEQITVWQAARKDWAEIEEAVTNAISEITERQLQRAAGQQMRTISVLGRIKMKKWASDQTLYAPSIATSYSNSSELRRSPRSRLSQIQTVRSESTVHPYESASRISGHRSSGNQSRLSFSLRELKRVLQTITEESSTPNRSTSAKPSSKHEYVRRRR
jgi:hypothetical protein